jgi:hypothetical protein
MRPIRKVREQIAFGRLVLKGIPERQNTYAFRLPELLVWRERIPRQLPVVGQRPYGHFPEVNRSRRYSDVDKQIAERFSIGEYLTAAPVFAPKGSVGKRGRERVASAVGPPHNSSKKQDDGDGSANDGTNIASS